MNIFMLHEDPEENVKLHCDKHVVKMILEYAQMLSNQLWYTFRGETFVEHIRYSQNDV